MTTEEGLRRGDAAGRMGDSFDVRGGIKRGRRNYQIGTAFAILIGHAGHEDPQAAYGEACEWIADLLATSGPEYRRLVALAAGVVQMIALDVAESRPMPVREDRKELPQQ